MAGTQFLLDGQRLIDRNGVSFGVIYFYQTGTSVLANIYTDAAMTIPAANPVVTLADGSIPTIYLNPTTAYRRYIIYADGETSNADPYYGPLTGSSLADFQASFAGPNGASNVGYAITGGVTQTVASKLNRIVFLEDFGGVADYNIATGTGTNNYGAFQAAFTYLGANGGTIKLRGSYYVGQNMTIPQYIRIEGDARVTGQFGSITAMQTAGAKIYHPTGTNLILSTGVDLCRIGIWAAGLQLNWNSSQITSNFLGNGVMLLAASQDICLEDCSIMGFLYGIYPQTITTDLSVTYGRLMTKGQISIDCINGMRLHNMGDICRINGVHCYPFTNGAATAEPNGAQLKRAGKAIWLSGLNDHTMVSQCFNYGYTQGYTVDNGADVTFINCDGDYPFQSATDGSYGFLVQSQAFEATFIGCQAIQRDVGFSMNPAMTSNAGLLNAQWIGCSAWECRTSSFSITTGKTKIIGGFSRSSFANAAGIQTGTDTSIEVSYSGHHFANLRYAVINGSSSIKTRDVGGNTYNAMQNDAVVLNPYISQVASGASITINPSDTVIQVSGTTSCGTIIHPSNFTGRTVTFEALNGFTFVTGGNIITKSGSNLVLGLGATCQFMSDGASWRQVA